MGLDALIYVEDHEKLSDVELRQYAYKLCSRFGADNFWIDKADGQHALRVVEKRNLISSKARAIEVLLSQRYYGPHYERGDWPLIRAVIEYVWWMFGTPVWYGHDCDSTSLMRMDGATIEKFQWHFNIYGHDPYRAVLSARDLNRPSCTFCGGASMYNCGGSRNKDFYSCFGCHTRIVRARSENYWEDYEVVDTSGWGWDIPAGAAPILTSDDMLQTA